MNKTNYQNLLSREEVSSVYNNQELKELLVNEDYNEFYKRVDSIINCAVSAGRNSYKYLVYDWKYISKEDAFQEVKLRIWNKISGQKIVKGKVVDCQKLDNYENLGSFIFNAVKFTLQEARNKAIKRNSIASFSSLDDLDYLTNNVATPEQIYLYKESKEVKAQEQQEVKKSTKRFKKFRAFDKKTKEFVAEFNTITEAARTLGCDKSHISAVLNGKRKSCKGFIFEYVTSYTEDDFKDVKEGEIKTDKCIRVYDFETHNLISNYKSLVDIANLFGCSSSNISGVLNGSRRSCKGLYFEYSA